MVDLSAQLDRAFAEQHKYEALLRELLEAQRNRKSEQMSQEELALFEAAWRAEEQSEDDDLDGDFPGGGPQSNQAQPNKCGGRQPLARNITHERIVPRSVRIEKHCHRCGQDLRLIEEETSERYSFVPASLRVIQDVCLKYA